MGRRAVLLLTVMATMLVVVGGTALAITYTTSKKAALNLNKSSFVATAATALYSNAFGPALTIGTDSTQSSATPLSLDTETSDQAPMQVDSETKVDKLNADKLDGKDSTAFLGATQQATDADKLDGKDSTAFYNGSTYIKFYTAFQTGTANGTDLYGITCESGDMVMSGGYEADTTASVPQIFEARTHFGIFAQGDNGYVLKSKNGATPAKLKLYVQCADLGTPLASATASSAKASAPTDSGKYTGAETEIESL